MGKRGPIPKRESQRRRRNKNEDELPTERAEGAAVVDVPPAKSSWHPAALKWYESLAKSGQSKFYEPSDWATAFIVAESMSRDLKPRVVGVNKQTGKVMTASLPLNGASLSAYAKAWSVLLTTEGDRRRARVELERPEGGGEEGGSNVSWIGEARRQ